MLNYLRRRFVAGFFVTVPLALSVAALIWIFGLADALTSPIVERAFGRRVPGLGIAVTGAGILVVGFFAANVIGRRLLQRAEHYLLLVPLFRSIYAPVKQLVWAFNPQNASGFKRVVLVDEPQRGREGRGGPGGQRHGVLGGDGRPGVADDPSIHQDAAGRQPLAERGARGLGKERVQAVEQAQRGQRVARGPRITVVNVPRYRCAACRTSSAVTASTARR